MDCSDFATQEVAQCYFEAPAASRATTWTGLDRDHDGIACEALP
jgi:hypothetical protein